VFAENFAVYGVRKVWRQMIRAGVPGARCTVARLIREMGLASVTRGKPVRATISDKAAPCPLDHVNRRFYAPAPNRLWSQTSPTSQPGRGSSTSPSSSIPMLGGSSAGGPAGRLMPASSSMHWNRRFTIVGRRIAAVSSIKYTERLADAGTEPSVGSVGDSYDNALAETINGLYKAEVIHRCGPWRSFEAVEYAALEWVDWFNHRRLLEPKINIMLLRTTSVWQRYSQPNASGRLGAVQRPRRPGTAN